MKYSQPNLDRRIKNILDTLPHRIDRTPEGKFEPTAQMSSVDYFDNEECFLMIDIEAHSGLLDVRYYAESDESFFLDINFKLDEPEPLEDEEHKLREGFYETFGKTIEELS